MKKKKKPSVLTVVIVSPGVVRFNLESSAVQDSKAIHDMGTKIGVNIFGLVFAIALSVPCPVCEVTNHLKIIPINALENFIVVL